MIKQKGRVIWVDFQQKKRIDEYGFRYTSETLTDYEHGIRNFFESLRAKRSEEKKGITSWPFGGGVDQHED